MLLYHAEFSVYGGYLGVESFFVVSGFLITSLLLGEWQQNGCIDLPAFWMRRARRLLPALLLPETLLALSVNQAATDPNDLATQVLQALLAQQAR